LLFSGDDHLERSMQRVCFQMALQVRVELEHPAVFRVTTVGRRDQPDDVRRRPGERVARLREVPTVTFTTSFWLFSCDTTTCPDAAGTFSADCNGQLAPFPWSPPFVIPVESPAAA
jgi:hypothetical protein